jgi:hypothetical protein
MSAAETNGQFDQIKLHNSLIKFRFIYVSAIMLRCRCRHQPNVCLVSLMITISSNMQSMSYNVDVVGFIMCVVIVFLKLNFKINKQRPQTFQDQSIPLIPSAPFLIPGPLPYPIFPAAKRRLSKRRGLGRCPWCPRRLTVLKYLYLNIILDVLGTTFVYLAVF